MRHRVVKTKLSRDLDHRKMLIKNLAGALFTYDKIVTTHSKAKFLQPYAETLITKAIKASKSQDKAVKYNTLKDLKNAIHSETAVDKLINDIAGRYPETSGGYTRVTKIGNRAGDNAEMSRIELTKTLVKKPKKGKIEKATEEKKEIKEN